MSRDVTDIHDAALKCGFYEWNSSKRIFQDQETANIASASDLQPSKKKGCSNISKSRGKNNGTQTFMRNTWTNVCSLCCRLHTLENIRHLKWVLGLVTPLAAVCYLMILWAQNKLRWCVSTVQSEHDMISCVIKFRIKRSGKSVTF